MKLQIDVRFTSAVATDLLASRAQSTLVSYAADIIDPELAAEEHLRHAHVRHLGLRALTALLHLLLNRAGQRTVAGPPSPWPGHGSTA